MHRIYAAVPGRIPALLAAVAIVVAGAGCNSGGGGGGGATGLIRSTLAVSNATVDIGPTIEVHFSLTGTGEKDVRIDLELSEDRGLTFRAGSVQGNPVFNTDGQQTIAWDYGADLVAVPQHDLMLRLTPVTIATGQPGTAALTGVFGIGGNSPPEVVDITTPSGVQGSEVTITFTVRDADGDHVVFSGEYSVDGGGTFHTATIQGSGPAAASPAAAPAQLVWEAGQDLGPGNRAGVLFRVTPWDTDEGTAQTTAGFTINSVPPATPVITVNGIPGSMNGSTTFTNRSGDEEAFHLAVPTYGFRIDIDYANPGGPDPDPQTLEVFSSRALGGGAASGGFDAGEDFGPMFDRAPTSAEWLVPDHLFLSAGTTTVSAAIRDLLGNRSLEATFSLEVTTVAGAFSPDDHWYLDFTRDNFSIDSSTDPSGWVTVTATYGQNGDADFQEDLAIIGLHNPSPIPEAVQANLNAQVMDLVRQEVAGRLNELYGRAYDGSPTGDSASVHFYLDPPPVSHSKIGIGGDDVVSGYTLGRAAYDYRNRGTEDNTDAHLGIFTTNLIDFYINTSFTFRDRFDPLIPGRGQPVGSILLDVTVLDPSFDRSDPSNTGAENARFDEIADAIDAIGRAAAGILAHEIGHSVGLVANGAPTAGLFGGEVNASFAGAYTNDFHLDTPGNNLMAAAIGFATLVATGSSAPRFNELNQAYLYERVIVK